MAYYGYNGLYGISPEQQMMLMMMGGGMSPYSGGYGMGYGYPSGYGYQNPFQMMMDPMMAWMMGLYQQQPYQQQQQQQFQPQPQAQQFGPFERGLADPNPQQQQPAQQNPYLPASMQQPAQNQGSGLFGYDPGAKPWDTATWAPTTYATRAVDNNYHQDSDYESWIKAGGGGYGIREPFQFANSTPDNGQSALNTLSGGSNMSTNSGGTSSGTYSESNPWGGLTNRPPDW